MAKITAMPSQDIIDGYKGTLDFYVHRGINCVRKWPASPGKIRSQAVMAQWPIFSNASRLWNQLTPAARQPYVAMAVSTNLTARDVFTKSYISGLFSWYTPPDDLPPDGP